MSALTFAAEVGVHWYEHFTSDVSAFGMDTIRLN